MSALNHAPFSCREDPAKLQKRLQAFAQACMLPTGMADES